MGEQVVLGEDGLDVAAVVAPVHPAFEYPGEHPRGGVGQPVGERARAEHVRGEVDREPPVQLDDAGVYAGGQAFGDGPATAEVPGPVALEQGELLP